MYIVKKHRESVLTSVPVYEGETIEKKIERIVENKEPITDGAPELFTERKEGIIAAYNIRTDRWELATDAMDAVQKSVAAKRENKGQLTVVKDEGKEDKEKSSGAETIQGENEA